MWKKQVEAESMQVDLSRKDGLSQSNLISTTLLITITTY